MPVPSSITCEFFPNDLNIYTSSDEYDYIINEYDDNTCSDEIVNDIEMHLFANANKAVIKHIHRTLHKLDSLFNASQQHFIDKCFEKKYGNADIPEDIAEEYMYKIFASKRYKQIEQHYKLQRYNLLNKAYRLLYKLFNNHDLRNRFTKWYKNEF